MRRKDGRKRNKGPTEGGRRGAKDKVLDQAVRDTMEKKKTSEQKKKKMIMKKKKKVSSNKKETPEKEEREDGGSGRVSPLNIVVSDEDKDLKEHNKKTESRLVIRMT